MSQPAITKFFASYSCDNDRQPKKRKTGYRPSAIESLPTELIEKIFLFSLNTSFTRASPRLAAAVSNERIYRLLIMLAFWDNDDYRNPQPDSESVRKYEESGARTWNGNEKYNVARILRPLGHDYVPISRDKRTTLQSAILRRKWCSIDRIRRQLPDLARLIITRRCFDAGYKFEDEDKGRELDEMLQSGEPRKYRGFTYRKVAGVPDDFETCLIITRPGEFVKIDFYPGYIKDTIEARLVGPTKSLWYPILSLRRVPGFLFRSEISLNDRGLVPGGFTDTHMNFLDTMIYSGQLLPIPQCETYLENMNIFLRRDIQQGIHIAISTINPLALDKLLRIDEALCRERFNYEGDYIYTIPSDHFKTAARLFLRNNPKRKVDAAKKKVRDDALLCFLLLLTSSSETVPCDDPVITKLAKGVGGIFGEWLEDFIDEFEVYLEDLEDDYMGSELFASRDPNEDSELAIRYLKDLMPADDLFKKPRDWMDADISRYADEEDMRDFQALLEMPLIDE